MGAERRRAPRYQLIAEAEIVEPHSKSRLKARISDVSLFGCYMNTIHSLPAGTEIQVRVTHHNDTFTTRGRVVRTEPTSGIGINSDNPKPDQQALLQKWLNGLSHSESQPGA